MKNFSKNASYIISLSLLMINYTAISMDKNGWSIISQIKNDTHTFTILRKYGVFIKTKGHIEVIKKLSTDDPKNFWEKFLSTPERHHSPWADISTKFSDDGSKAFFAQYGKDDRNGYVSGIEITVFDLKTETTSTYCRQGKVGKDW